VKRIVIVGILPRQIAIVRQRVGRVAELHFVRNDVGRPRFPRGVEHIVMMLKFVSHGISDAARGAGQVHYASGLNGVIQAIKEIAGG
jgi:hypothetical protein